MFSALQSGPYRSGRSDPPRAEQSNTKPRASRSLGWPTAARATAAALIVALALPACDRGPEHSRAARHQAAAAALADGDLPQAIALFKDLAVSDPSDPESRWQLGKAFIELRLPTEAETHLRRALELGISPSAVLPALAQVLILQGEYQAALDLSEPTVLSPKARAAIAAEKALAHLEAEQTAEARRAIDRATAQAPGFPSNPRETLIAIRVRLAEAGPEPAREDLRQALERFPNAAALWALQGDIERGLGNLDNADPAYTKAIELAPFDILYRTMRARVRLDLPDPQSAEEDIRLVERRLPGSFEALFLRGRLALRLGQPEDAAAALQRAMLQDRSSVEAMFFAAVAAQSLGRINEAEDLLTRAKSSDPGFLPAWYALGLLLIDQNRFAEAEHLLRAVTSADPDNSAALTALAATLTAQGGSGKAIELLQRADRDPRTAPAAAFQMGVALFASGKASAGEEILDAVARENPSWPTVHRFMLSHFLAVGDLQSARRWLERYRAALPAAADPLVWKARIQLAEGNRDAAAATLEAAVELEPQGPQARYALARLSLADGRPEEARRELLAIVAAGTGHRDALLALAAMDAGTGGDALGWIERAVRTFPDDPVPLVELGRFHLVRGRPRDALTALRMRSEDGAFKGDPAFLRTLGEAEVASGELLKAITTFHKLTRLLPQSAPDHYAYARLLMATDDRIRAEEALARVLELDPDNRRARLDQVRLLLTSGDKERAREVLAPLADSPLPEAKVLAAVLAEDTAPERALALMDEAHRAAPSTRTLLLLARLSARQHGVATAIELERDWLASQPNDLAVQLALAQDLVERGAAGDREAAVDLYRQVLARHPDQLEALNNLAWHLRETDAQAAIGYAEHAVQLVPDSDGAADTLAAAYAAAGRLDDALRATEIGLLHNAGSETLLLRKARLLHRVGQESEAIKLLADLARSPSGSAEQREATQALDDLLASGGPADGQVRDAAAKP